MKIVPKFTFSTSDIREAMQQAHKKLPVGKKFSNGLSIRVLRDGPVSQLYLWSDDQKRAVGVATVQRDKLLQIYPTINGLVITQAGLLPQFRGFGFMWRVIDALGQKYRVFAHGSMTNSGKKMWMKRVLLDRRHVYLLYRPQGFKKGPMLQITRNNVKQYEKIIWDGSLKTRLIMVGMKDPLVKKYAETSATGTPGSALDKKVRELEQRIKVKEMQGDEGDVLNMLKEDLFILRTA